MRNLSQTHRKCTWRKLSYLLANLTATFDHRPKARQQDEQNSSPKNIDDDFMRKTFCLCLTFMSKSFAHPSMINHYATRFFIRKTLFFLIIWSKEKIGVLIFVKHFFWIINSGLLSGCFSHGFQSMNSCFKSFKWER